MLDVRFPAYRFEGVISGGCAFSRSAETLGELLPVVSEDFEGL